MVRAFSKAVWQRRLVLGSGVGCSSSPLCWCPSVVSLLWLPVGSACLAYLVLVLLRLRGSFLAGPPGMAGGENSIVFMSLVLTLPANIIHFLVFQMLSLAFRKPSRREVEPTIIFLCSFFTLLLVNNRCDAGLFQALHPPLFQQENCSQS